MDDLFELILGIIDSLTGHKLDYGISQLVRKLTRNVKNEKVREALHLMIWAILFLTLCAILVVLLFLIEAWRMGKI